MSSSALPPYLISGASSRAHHAHIARLNDARSTQEEDALIDAETERCRIVLAGHNVSTAKVAECLIILLHCSITRHTATGSLDWALLSALQLAEGGRTIKERRVGYLYLCERLPRGHELGLLLINTIRKDLTSERSSDVLMALHVVVKLHLADIGPAITPLLTSKALLKHELPAVRQRTLQALVNIYSDGTPLPLSMSRLIKMLGAETDTEVIATILRVMTMALKKGNHLIQSREEGQFIVQQIIEAADRGNGRGGQLALDVLRALGTAVGRSDDPEIMRIIAGYVLGRLKYLDGKSLKRMSAAFLLETCVLSKTIALPVQVNAVCLNLISLILLQSDITPSSSFAPLGPSPNQHVLAIRCLYALPREAWDGKLGEEEMRIIMQGLESPDDSVRRATLRLLRNVSPELLDMTFESLCSSIQDSTDLFLPVTLPQNVTPDAKLIMGRWETAGRALDVLEVQYCGEPESRASDAGKAFASGFMRLTQVLKAGGAENDVWDDGIRRVLTSIKNQSPSWLNACTAQLLTPTGDPTSAIIRATCLCEFGTRGLDDSLKALEILATDLRTMKASVSELSLVAAFAITARLSDRDRRRAVDQLLGILKETRTSLNKHMQKRSDKISAILQDDDKITDVMSTARSHSLIDILDTLNTFQLPNPPPQRSSPSTNLLDNDVRASRKLRYEAYKPPERTSSSSSTIRRDPTRPTAIRSSHRGRESRLSLPSAGELALLDPDEQHTPQNSDGLGLGLSLSQLTIRNGNGSHLGNSVESVESVDETSRML
ncbi:armadillo-type protein [Naematelia encephala]|uniref:Armadillo-type protein n=1 Tax=Naematelia encephala TaxID=71784 RepID=A0A1Y2AMS1_9TREE|nr:armadillo-type protein [Naematelia encephala]